MRPRLFPLHGLTQRRWAQVHDVRFVATNRASHNIMDRYHAKLSAKAAEEGHNSVDKLKEAYQDKIADMRRNEKVEIARPPEIPPAPIQTSSVPKETAAPDEQAQKLQKSDQTTPLWTLPRSSPNPIAGGQGSPDPCSKIKTLSQILDLRKIHPLRAAEISAIWRLRYATNPQSLTAVIPIATYNVMEAVARRCPQFVLPVPRVASVEGDSNGDPKEAKEAGAGGGQMGAGAEIHFLQWTFDKASKTSSVLFTHLAEFKMRAEYAVPHTVVTHHLDLAESKGLVLMEGHVTEDRGVSPDDATWLVMCLQKFYGGWDRGSSKIGDEANVERAERAKQRMILLESFASGDKAFSLQKLIDEAESMG